MQLKLFSGSSVHILLFTDVTNTPQLMSKLSTSQINASFINAALIPDLFVLSMAVDTALRKQKDQSMATRSVYTEIIFCLSPTRKISKALSIFGLNASTKHIMAVIPQATGSEVDCISQLIFGKATEPTASALNLLVDLPRLKSIYSITPGELALSSNSTSSLGDAILTRMSLRDIK